MAKTAADIAAKQVRRAQESAGDYVNGVNAVTESPTAKAVKKKDKLLSNFTASVTSGKWEDGLNAVSLDDWKSTTAKKGGERYASGVAASEDKIAAFHAEFQPFLAGVKREIDQMPDTTPEQRIQKMIANAKAIAKFKRAKRRR